VQKVQIGGQKYYFWTHCSQPMGPSIFEVNKLIDPPSYKS
jgi:hypothetical protein